MSLGGNESDSPAVSAPRVRRLKVRRASVHDGPVDSSISTCETSSSNPESSLQVQDRGSPRRAQPGDDYAEQSAIDIVDLRWLRARAPDNNLVARVLGQIEPPSEFKWKQREQYSLKVWLNIKNVPLNNNDLIADHDTKVQVVFADDLVQHMLTGGINCAELNRQFQECKQQPSDSESRLHLQKVLKTMTKTLEDWSSKPAYLEINWHGEGKVNTPVATVTSMAAV